MLNRVLDLSSETDAGGADSTFSFKNNDIVEPIEEGLVFLHRACHTVPHPACAGAYIPCTHKQPPSYTYTQHTHLQLCLGPHCQLMQNPCPRRLSWHLG